jgi:hypothetical protein
MDATIKNIVEQLDDESIDLEIVCLHAGNNHRNCCQHEICGRHVIKSDLLRLVSRVIGINSVTENAVSLVKLDGESHTCTVAFVPRAFLEHPSIADRIGNVAIVEEIYSDSHKTIMKRLDGALN